MTHGVDVSNHRAQHRKTAIILVGGGMKSAHGAGFLYALEKEWGLRKPDIMIGSSGDAGNVLYYCAGQIEEVKRIWLKRLTTSRFISLWRFWKIMDVDYLVDEVFKRQEPLNVSAVQTSLVQWLIPLSDVDTGQTRYASAQDQLDPLEILRAANAIPYLFGKKVSLRHNRYIDGELGPILQDHLDKALSLGASRVLIVNHTRNWTHSNSISIRLYSHLIARGMHDAIQRDISTDVTAYHAEQARVMLINPTKLPCGTATHDAEKIKATFDRGLADSLALQHELRTLLDV